MRTELRAGPAGVPPGRAFLHRQAARRRPALPAALIAAAIGSAGCGPVVQIGVTVGGEAGGPVEVMQLDLVSSNGEARTVTFWPDGESFVLPVTFTVPAGRLVGSDVTVTATALSDGGAIASGSATGPVAEDGANAFDVTLAPLPAVCGDGVVEDAEACDGTDLGGATCETAGLGPGTLACTAGCALDPSGCCGDGVAGAGETCDGADLGGASCGSEGMGSGLLACQADCAGFDYAACILPPVPVLRRPMNGSYLGDPYVTGSRRPTFVWEPWPSPGTIIYTLEYGTDVLFVAGTTVVTSADTVYQPPGDLPISFSPPVGARYYWHVRACAGADCSGWSPTWWVQVGASEQDFDGDGCADALVGSPNAAPAGPETGSAYAYRGELLTYLEATVDRTFGGTSAGEASGAAVATAGDLNGDGFGDLAVGAPESDFAGDAAGRVYLFFGGVGGTWDVVPDAILDGEAAGDRFGAAVDGAGDVNADGYADLVIGAPGTSNAYVFHGGAGTSLEATADAVLEGDGFFDAFGASVAGVRDFDGDGYGDLLVGAPSTDGGAGIDSGRVYFFRGGAAGIEAYPDGFFEAAGAGDALGAAVAAAGDLNGDGFADLVAGAPQSTAGGAGYAAVILGGVLAGPLPVVLAPAALLLGATPGGGFGAAVSGAGDADGDGLDDLVVGAPGADGPLGGEGTATLFLGSSAPGFDALADAVLSGPAAGSSYGFSVAGAGDLNGDGAGDALVGTPGSGAGGAAWVYFGAAGGWDAVPEAILLGPAGELTGWSVR